MGLAVWLSAVGLALVAGGGAALTRKRAWWGKAALCVGGCVAIPGLLGISLHHALVGYVPLNQDHQVASISFARQGPDLYQGSLQLSDGGTRPLQIHGDEWQIDARVLTWTSWARKLGMKPLYRFERLSGRYADIEDERGKPRSVHGLQDHDGSWWQEWMDQGARIPGADAYYGTAAFLPMAEGAVYAISISDSGLVIRPDNAAAARAVHDW